MLDWSKVRRLVIPEGVVRKISSGGVVLWGRFVSLCSALVCGAVSSAAALKSVMAKKVATLWRKMQRAKVWLHEQRSPPKQIKVREKVWMRVQIIAGRGFLRIAARMGSVTSAVSAAVKQFRRRALEKIQQSSKVRLSGLHDWLTSVRQKIMFAQTARMKLSGEARQTLVKIAGIAKIKMLVGIECLSAVKTGLKLKHHVSLLGKVQAPGKIKRMAQLRLLSRLKETASAHSTKIPAALKAKIKMRSLSAAYNFRNAVRQKILLMQSAMIKLGGTAHRIVFRMALKLNRVRLSVVNEFLDSLRMTAMLSQMTHIKLGGAAHQILAKITQSAKTKMLVGIGYLSAVKTRLKFYNRVTLFWKTQELRAMKQMTRLSILSHLKETASAHSTKIPAALRAKTKMLGGHGWFAAFESRMKLTHKVTILGKVLVPGTIKQISNLRLLSGLKKAASVCKMKLPAALRPKIKMLGEHGWFTHWRNFSRLSLKMTMNGSEEIFGVLRERMRESDRMTLRGAGSKLKGTASSALSSHFRAVFGFSTLSSGISRLLQSAKLWLRCAAPGAMAARLSEAFHRSARMTSAIVGRAASGEVLRHERNAVRLGSVSGTLSSCFRRMGITLRNPKIVFSAIDKTAVWIQRALTALCSPKTIFSAIDKATILVQRAAAKCSLFGSAEPAGCAPILASSGAAAVMAIAIAITTWEAPVQTGRSLLITQVHSVEQTGNKIKLT